MDAVVVDVTGAQLRGEGHVDKGTNRGGGGRSIIEGGALEEVGLAGVAARPGQGQVVKGLRDDGADTHVDDLVDLGAVHDGAVAPWRRLGKAHRGFCVAVEQPHRRPRKSHEGGISALGHDHTQHIASEKINEVNVIVTGAQHQVIEQLTREIVDDDGHRLCAGGGVGVFETVVDANPAGQLAARVGKVANLGDGAVEVVLAGRGRHLTQGGARVADQRRLAVGVGEAQVLRLATSCANVSNQTRAAINIAKTRHAATGTVATQQIGAVVVVVALARALSDAHPKVSVASLCADLASQLRKFCRQGARRFFDAEKMRLVAALARRTVEAPPALAFVRSHPAPTQGAEFTRCAGHAARIRALFAKPPAQLAELGRKYTAKGGVGAVRVALTATQRYTQRVDALFVRQASDAGHDAALQGRGRQHWR